MVPFLEHFRDHVGTCDVRTEGGKGVRELAKNAAKQHDEGGGGSDRNELLSVLDLASHLHDSDTLYLA